MFVSNTVFSTVPHARKQGESVNEDAYDGARRLLVEALELAGGGIPRQSRHLDPVTELRDELRARTGARVLVACSALGGLGDLLGGEPAEVLRAEVLAQTHQLTVLHYDVPAMADQHVLAAFAASGSDVWLLATPPPEAVLVDDDLAVLPGDTGVTLVRSPAAVRALLRSYQAMRAVAVEFAVLNDAVTTFLGSRLLAEVLGTLCVGMKDESAARQMRISVRTYRRYVASILKSLNVTSRFEAGMRLSEVGLTDLARRRAAGPSRGLGGPGGAPEGGVEQAGEEDTRDGRGEAQQHDPYWGHVEE